MLRMVDIRKTFPETGGPGGAAFAVAVSLTVERGELLGLVGPSGSGKSSILRLAAGFESPDSGRVFLNNHDVTDQPPNRRKIAYVFQDYALFPHLSVAGNIGYGLRVQRVPPAAIAARVRELLALVHLPGIEHRAVGELSGGEQQRVAIARALAPDPQLLVLDEPFSSLDSHLRGSLRAAIRELQQHLRIATILVTHNRREALAVSDRIVVLRSGRIEQQGNPREVYEKPCNAFVGRFLGEATLLNETNDGTLCATAEPMTQPQERADEALRPKSLGPRSQRQGLLRPEHILVNPTPAQLADRPDTLLFDGTVTAVEYGGYVTLIRVATACGEFVGFDRAAAVDRAAVDRTSVASAVVGKPAAAVTVCDRPVALGDQCTIAFRRAAIAWI